MAMKFKSIKSKISILVGLSTSVVIAVLIAYIGWITRDKAIRAAQETAQSVAMEYAAQIKGNLEQSLETTRLLVQSFEGYEDIRAVSERRSIYAATLRNYLDDTEFLAAKTFWEPSSIDNRDSLLADDALGNSGRFVKYFYVDNKATTEDQRIKEMLVTPSLERSIANSPYYQAALRDRRPVLLEPYYNSYNNNREDEVLLTSIVVPVISQNRTVGIVATDIGLERVGQMLDSLNIYGGGMGFLLSNQAVFVSHPEPAYLGKSYKEVYPLFEREFDISQKVKTGMPFTFSGEMPEDKEDHFVVLVPMNIGNVATWAFGVAVPTDNILVEANQSLKVLVGGGGVGLMVLLLLVRAITEQITRPLSQTTLMLKRLAEGDIASGQMHIRTSDEMLEMTASVNALLEGLRKTADFAKAIGQGRLDTEFAPLSPNDVLGNSLVAMRSSLLETDAIDEKRRLEDQRRNWATEGLAKFGDILRQNNENLKELCFNVIQNLVRYVEANQGGMFIYNDETDEPPHLELYASLAYDRRKYTKKKIGLKEGLVGACALEMDTIFMHNVPDNYVEIRSGLGTANPNSILIVPLKIDGRLLGVVELASFKRFEPHQIQFVETLAENIASTISNTRINEKTAMLLEQSRRQSEEMAAQEEEMRQNLEELQATQEESHRRQAEMQSILDGLDSSFYVAQFDSQGRVLTANDALLRARGLAHDQLKGLHHRAWTNPDSQEEYPEGYEHFWSSLRDLQVRKKEQAIASGGRTTWLSESYIPLADDSHQLRRVLWVATDITEQKEQQQALEEQSGRIQKQQKQLEANMSVLKKAQDRSKARQAEMQAILDGLDSSFYVAQFDANGTLLSANGALRSARGINHEHIGRLGHRDLTDPDSAEDYPQGYEQFWRDLQDLKVQKKQQSLVVGGKTLWFSENFIPLTGDGGKLQKILWVATDITEQKEQQQALEQQSDRIQKQQKQLEANMSVLKKAQDKSKARQAENKSILDGLDNSFLIAYLDPRGKVLSANDLFLRALGMELAQLVGQPYAELGGSAADGLDEVFAKLHQGKSCRVSRKLDLGGRALWLNENYSPIFSTGREVEKVMVVSIDTTASQHQQAELRQMMESINEQNEIMRAQEEMMRANLEEMVKYQQDLEEKRRETDKANAKLKSNEAVLKKAVERGREDRQALQAFTRRVAELEEELRKLKGGA